MFEHPASTLFYLIRCKRKISTLGGNLSSEHEHEFVISSPQICKTWVKNNEKQFYQ